MYKLIIYIAIFLVGCDSPTEKLPTKAEQLSMEKQQCLVKRVLYQDCDEFDERIERFELELQRAELRPRDEQIEAAYELGRLSVEGDESESIYERVYDSLMNFTPGNNLQMIFSGLSGTFGPLRKDYNYLIFTDRCREFSHVNFYQRMTSITGFVDSQEPEPMDVEIFFRHSTSCFRLENLQSKYAILSEEQVDLLSDANIKALKFKTYDKARKFVDSVLGK